MPLCLPSIINQREILTLIFNLSRVVNIRAKKTYEIHITQIMNLNCNFFLIIVIYECNKVNSTNWCHDYGPNSTLDSGCKQSNKQSRWIPHRLCPQVAQNPLGKLWVKKFSDMSPAHRGVRKICLAGRSWKLINSRWALELDLEETARIKDSK